MCGGEIALPGDGHLDRARRPLPPPNLRRRRREGNLTMKLTEHAETGIAERGRRRRRIDDEESQPPNTPDTRKRKAGNGAGATMN
jgi:hypothetical protein